MKEYRRLWKQMAKDKSITREDTFQYCILRAMTSISEDKLSVAKHILQSAFTPITNYNKLECCKYKPYEAVSLAAAKSAIRSSQDRPGILLSVLETSEEIDQFNKIRSAVYKLIANDMYEYYSFLIVRTDLTPEQQLVQAAHVGIVLGAELMDVPASEYADAKERLSKLNLVVCGSPNKESLEGDEDYIVSNGYSVTEFVEPDIGNQVTAIISEPIKATAKRFMRKYRLLKFNPLTQGTKTVTVSS